MSEHNGKQVVIIGGGPAGLTAAYTLCRASVAAVVLEKDDILGGLSRTVNYQGYHFDIGGHRFFTKVKSVEEVWREVLDDGDFLRRRRLSRIYYNKKFIHYPLRFSSTLVQIGVRNGVQVVLSYLWARLFPESHVASFEQWVTNQFGKRFYQLFFKTYTEKIWGIPCKELSAEWAAQRIKGLSLSAAFKNLFLKRRGKGKEPVIKTLIEEFDYPRRGPGMMWEAMAGRIIESGGDIRMAAQVVKIRWNASGIEAVEVDRQGSREVLRGSHFISSMPIRELVSRLSPEAPPDVLAASARLNYRDFITVVLIVNRRDVFPDNWIYIHDPGVRMGRIQNFKNWSPDMVDDSEKTCLGLEYFCFEGDGLWAMKDEELIELGKRELAQTGLVQPSEVAGGVVVRVPKAYPVYDHTYKEALRVVRCFLDRLDNLQLVGRNGMHKYNNQDHSMFTAMLAVENILGANHDLWEVNTDQEYLEERAEARTRDLNLLRSTQPLVPEPFNQHGGAPVEFEAEG